MLKLKLVIIISMFFPFVGPANAYVSAGMGMAMMDSAMGSSARNVNRNASSLVSGNNISRPAKASTKYTPSVQRRKANLAQFISKTRAVDPQGAKQMEQVFSSSDVIADIGKGIAQYGLRGDNVADAYTLYWINAWQAAHGQYGDPPNDQIALVKTQSANALLSTPEFIDATDAIKQEMSEAYLIQSVMISQYMELAKDDPKMKSKLAAAVRKGAKASGLDLDAMTLTDEGFVPARKGSDASDAVPPAPGAEEKALAANDTESTDTTTYALIAAAGAGTLAAVFGLGKMMGRRG